MTIQGGRGKFRVHEDFARNIVSTTITSGTALNYNDLLVVAVSGNGTIISTVTESGGVIDTVGAGAAADGVVYMVAAPGQPSTNGTMIIEARCKNSTAADFRFFCGFQSTTSLTETINPWTLSGTTLTANAAGEAVGFYFDSAATTDDMRFMAGSNSSASTGAQLSYALGGQTTLGSLGVRALATITADRWFICRVELDSDGTARGYFGDETMGNPNGLTHVATLKAGDLTTTSLYTPNVQLLAQTTGNPHGFIDYLTVEYNRDWDDA